MKRVLLLSSLVISLQADMGYTLEKQAYSQEKYFIKIAAFSELKNAQKLQVKTPFQTNIIFMDKYHSLVSEELQDKNEAKKYLKKIREKFGDAYLITLYQKEQRAEPLAPKVKKVSRLGEAALLYQQKRYEEALMAFDRMLIENPDNVSAKIYYAKTLYQLKLFSDAKKEFQELLFWNLEEEKKNEVKKYLAAIHAKKKRHFFKTQVGVGIGYDDNIDLTTKARETKYGPYTLINDTNKTDSAYGLATLRLTHRYKATGFDFYSSLYSYNEFSHSATGNDLNYIDVSTAVLKRVKNFSFLLPIGFNTSYLEGDTIGYNLYTNPSISYNHTRYLKTFVQASYIDNTTKFAVHRDYTAVSSGLGIRYAKKKFQSSLGVSMQKVSAKEDLRYDISKDVIAMMLQGRYYLFTSFYIASDIAFVMDMYSELDDVMGYKREDDILSYGISMGKTFSKNFLLQMKYQHSENESNVNAYSHEKNNYTIECKYKF